MYDKLLQLINIIWCKNSIMYNQPELYQASEAAVLELRNMHYEALSSAECYSNQPPVPSPEGLDEN